MKLVRTAITLSLLLMYSFAINAQSSSYIVKSGTENGEFSGGIFVGHSAFYTTTGTPFLKDETDSTTYVVWKDEVGVEEINDTLIKTGSTGWGNSGAVSNNQLKSIANGWIDYIVNDLSSILEFGFTKNDTAGLDSIHYALRLNAGQLYVYNSGTPVDTIGGISIGDSIRIERLGNVLLYTKNARIYYNQEVNAKDSLRIEVAINSYNSPFYVRSTFGLESLIVNTIGMDTLDSPDTLRYSISGVQGITGTHYSNSIASFNPKGIATGVKTVTASFFGYPGSDSAKVLFDIDKYRNVSNVRFKINDTINNLDSSLFLVDRTGVLAIHNGINKYENQLSPYLNILLDGGISLTPNNDGDYDSLMIESNVPVTSYYINVTSVAGDTLYESTNILLAWNGKTSGGDPVEIGNYYYHIMLNGRLTEGIFLVEY